MFLRRWWKQHASRPVIGLDIDSDVIKLLKINTRTSPYLVEHFATFPLPAGCIIKNEIKDPAAIINVLNNIFKKPQLREGYIALAIPRSSAIVKNVSVDSRLTEGEIESRAWVEANRNFPDLVGEIYLDFSITGPSTQDSSQLDMVLVACRKDQIDSYLELLKEAGLNTKIVDVNCYALERSLITANLPIAANEAIALLNLNFNLSTLIVNHDSLLVYSHDHTYDGHRLINQVRKYFNDETTIASEPFQQKEPLQNEEGYNALLKENLSAHLRHTMHFFYSSRPNIAIKKVILSGDCATVPKLAEFIQQEINIATEIADPFKNMQFAPEVDKEKIQLYAPTLMLCCGLALSTLIKGKS